MCGVGHRLVKVVENICVVVCVRCVCVCVRVCACVSVYRFIEAVEFSV